MTKFCVECKYHLQCDGYPFNDPKYHKCEYKQFHGHVKQDIISKQYPLVTCKDMRAKGADCGEEGKLWEKKY
jgi:hypothetical protein